MEKKANILLIDDSEDDVILMIHHIKQVWPNFEYEWVDTRDKLLKQLDAETNWNIIICDIVLPQLTGPEIVKIIREKKIKTPIICVSGSIIGIDGCVSVEEEAEAFIDKANLKELAETVKEILSRKK